MLLELEKYGINKGYFIKKKLKEFSEAKNDGFSHINEEVIDFDETGKCFSHLNLKTADVLKFNNNLNLKFIEFKNIKNSSNIDFFIENLFLNLKVQESFQLLRNILNENDFGTKNNRNNFNKTKNDFIFSIACNKLDPKISILLDMEISGLEDYEKTLEKVIWIETKDLEKYL